MSLEQWESFYRGGLIATCPTSADGGYDLEVRDAWVEFFSTLADEARILDIGTGNGVVAMIAAETAQALGRNWQIDATDLAQINPLRDVPEGARRLAGIRFHPGVATEHLPFEAQTFDAVSGHFALEYSDVPAALAELHRVLKPGGNAQFVLQHTDSIVLNSVRRSLEQGELVLVETRIFRRLHKLVTMENLVPGTTERVTAELREAIQTLKQAYEQARQSGSARILAVALDAVQKLLTARKDMRPEAVGLEVDKAENEVRASVRRLNDVAAHARDSADMEKLEKQAAAAGFSQIEHRPLHHSGANLIGWQLMLHRA